MERFQPYARWLAIAGAAGALAIAFFAPRHFDSAAAPEETPIAVPSDSPAARIESPAPADVAVYVCGAVRKAGVYRIAAGSRIVDAVKAAGGLSSDADPEAINLAEPVVDGMKVDVLKKGAHSNEFFGEANSSSGSGGPVHRGSSRHRSGGRGSAHKLAPGQTLNINTATEAELVQLPGVGPGLARRIVEYRQANGPFATIDDLQNVSGIGPSKFAKLEEYVRL